MAYLNVRDIKKQFGGLLAVDTVSFHVDKGEIVSLIGPNGAGKTTIFNLLTGVYEIDGGEITFDGSPIDHLSPEGVLKAGLARTFQNIRLFNDLRVIENVLIGMHTQTAYGFGAALFRTKKFRVEEKKNVQKAVEILESIGLGHEMHHYAESLSYGAKRKLEIARAMATGAKMLFLDEPVAGMNTKESESLMDFIRHLRDMGYTIVLIEHDMSVVMNISDRIYVLDHGKKIAEGQPADIVNNEDVIRAYLGGVKKDA